MSLIDDLNGSESLLTSGALDIILEAINEDDWVIYFENDLGDMPVSIEELRIIVESVGANRFRIEIWRFVEENASHELSVRPFEN